MIFGASLDGLGDNIFSKVVEDTVKTSSVGYSIGSFTSKCSLQLSLSLQQA